MKKIIIIGMGKSGKSLYRFLEKEGHDLYVFDDHLPKDHPYQLLDREQHYDLALLSPGIKLDHPVVRWCVDQGIELQGEIQFAASQMKGKLIGVTGTNGKSTTVHLIHELLRSEKKHVFLAGNIGYPLVDFVEDSLDDHLYVVELSSFQLASSEDLNFAIGAILNITPDHVLWHGSFDEYVQAKLHLLKQSEVILLNADDPLLLEYAEEFIDQDTLYFSKERPMRGAFVEEGVIYYDHGHKEAIMKCEEILLEGDFNLENALSAIVIAKLLGISNESIKQVLASFKGIPHRYELLGEWRGIRVINDSKATNPESTIPKLKSVNRPTILIAGGMDKESDFSELASLIRENIEYVYLFGENKLKLLDALGDYSQVDVVSNLDEAFRASIERAHSGYTILLSPASASWDMYESYEKRGDHLRRLFGELHDQTT